MRDLRITCDRCGKLIPEPITMQIRALDFDKKGPDFVRLDICRSCMNGFWNYMSKRVISYSDISKEDF